MEGNQQQFAKAIHKTMDLLAYGEYDKASQHLTDATVSVLKTKWEEPSVDFISAYIVRRMQTLREATHHRIEDTLMDLAQRVAEGKHDGIWAIVSDFREKMVALELLDKAIGEIAILHQ